MNRKQFIKFAGSLALTPALLRCGGKKKTNSTSGELNVFVWQDYLNDDIINAFEKKTGIKINWQTYGSNEEVFNKLKATNGKGYDIAFPSLGGLKNYYQEDILQPWDESRIDSSKMLESLWKAGRELDGFYRGKRYHVPFNWGTEGITIDTEQISFDPKKRYSLKDLWSEQWAGKISFRPKSCLVGVVRWLSTEKDYGYSIRDAYADSSPDKMEKLLSDACDFMIENKSKVRSYWNNATEALNNFQQDKCIFGQTWDSTGITLYKETNGRIRYAAPKEGLFTWIDGSVLSKNATNIDQAYEFVNFLLEPKIGAMHVDATGYSSASKDFAKYIKPESKEVFEACMTQEDLDNLWYWPVEQIWFSNLRTKYVNKFIAA